MLKLKSVDEELAYSLARNGINTREKLAEQSVDELIDIEGMNEEIAAEIIMEAREIWFDEDNSNKS